MSAESRRRLDLDGDLSVVAVADQWQRLRSFLATNGADGRESQPDAPGSVELEIDLDRVAEFDGAGLQLLLAAGREAQRTGRVLRLLGANRAVAEVLSVAHLGEDLGVIEPSRDVEV